MKTKTFVTAVLAGALPLLAGWQNLPSLWVPVPVGLSSGPLNTSTLVVDASGKKVAVVFRAPTSGSLQKVAFRTGSVVQNQTIRVSFQDVDLATGLPDGIVDQWRNISILDTDDNLVMESGVISSDGTDGGSLRSVAQGELVAAVFEQNPFNAGDVFRMAFISTSGLNLMSAYPALYTTSWARQVNSPMLTILYSDGKSYHQPAVWPAVTTLSSTSYHSGSTDPKRGLKFRLPFSAKIAGALVRVKASSGANFDVKLYDSDGQTVLRSVFIDADTVSDNTYTQTVYVKWAEQALTKDTYYYILVEPTTTNSVELQYFDVPTGKEIYLDQMCGGQSFHYAVRSTGAPTATTTRRPLISIEVSAFDDGAGAGGAAMPTVISY